MKTLYMIGGPMGVGKSTVCQHMKERLHNSIFLDGDWCWDAHPFQVTDETKSMVIQNICFLLNQFLHCSAYEHVIFCWVMHEQSIIDSILKHVDKENCNIRVISLVCSSNILIKRLEKDVELGMRTEDVIERSMERLPFYDELNTEKINTDNKSVGSIVNEIISSER